MHKNPAIDITLNHDHESSQSDTNDASSEKEISTSNEQSNSSNESVNITESQTDEVNKSHQEHNEEIKRRLGISLERQSMNDITTPGFEKGSETGEGVNIPFTRLEQQFVVFSTSHVGMAPIVSTPNQAGVRVYGVFPTSEDALEYAQEAMSLDEDCNFQIGKVKEWILAANSIEHLQDATYVHTKCQNILTQYSTQLEQSKNQFKTYMEDPDNNRPTNNEQNHASVPKNHDNSSTSSETLQPDTSEKNIYRKRFDRRLEIREQNYAVVSIIADPNDQSFEFLFTVWGCFSSEKECDGWIREVASKINTEYAMHVVNMYEWIKPGVMKDTDDAVVTHYRNQEMDKIMKHAQRHSNDIDGFKTWCRDNDTTPPTIDI